MAPEVERYLEEQAAAFERWAAEYELQQRPILEELARKSDAVWAEIAAGETTP